MPADGEASQIMCGWNVCLNLQLTRPFRGDLVYSQLISLKLL